MEERRLIFHLLPPSISELRSGLCEIRSVQDSDHNMLRCELGKFEKRQQGLQIILVDFISPIGIIIRIPDFNILTASSGIYFIIRIVVTPMMVKAINIGMT